VDLFRRLATRNPNNSEAHYYLGITLMFQHHPDAALPELDRAIALDRQNFYAYVAAYSMLLEAGQKERALSYLERWLSDHPEDSETRALLEGRRNGATVPLPRPPLQEP
jgi:tetratricopeptide (TPR) repeat protein